MARKTTKKGDWIFTALMLCPWLLYLLFIIINLVHIICSKKFWSVVQESIAQKDGLMKFYRKVRAESGMKLFDVYYYCDVLLFDVFDEYSSSKIQ